MIIVNTIVNFSGPIKINCQVGAVFASAFLRVLTGHAQAWTTVGFVSTLPPTGP